MNSRLKRVVCLVADSLGVGAAPDAKDFGDEGCHTLKHLAERVCGLSLPNFEKLGLGLMGQFQAIRPVENPLALISRMAEQSKGKDTTTGHWELAGIVTRKPFAVFPNGFPLELLDPFVRESGVAGVLGNYAASGTEIIKELGDEHVRTQRPIVYTSADSVFQIAAHEETFGLDRLYQICEVARKLTVSCRIARVIARPFVGSKSANFKRTGNRKDYSLVPALNSLDLLCKNGVSVFSVGKIDDIFCNRGITEGNHTKNNADGLRATLEFLKRSRGKRAFIFTNLLDFDQLFGHRRDPVGYAKALEEMDAFLPRLLEELGEGDVLMITADHGCDPTFKGTDHTREYVPLIWYEPGRAGKVLKDRNSFSDVAASILEGFGISGNELPDLGSSFLCN